MYELNLLAYSCCAALKDEPGEFEYAQWRCRQLIDVIEQGSDGYDAESYAKAINNWFPIC